ncbi:MAG: hypothetical protein FK734_17825 [Asgard group archaeon]|nr:hypothetical protein [Asgard group archaeon]
MSHNIINQFKEANKLIDPETFTHFLNNNFQFITGVPCSYFKEFLMYISQHEIEISLKHIIATREDEAIGIASGAVLSNKQVIIYMQNSGLGNIGDALTSLSQLYRLPMLLLISYRGLEADRDFPEHSIMGEINESLLQTLKIPFWVLSEKNWQKEMTKAIQKMNDTSLPVAILVDKGVLSQ